MPETKLPPVAPGSEFVREKDGGLEFLCLCCPDEDGDLILQWVPLQMGMLTLLDAQLVYLAACVEVVEWFEIWNIRRFGSRDAFDEADKAGAGWRKIAAAAKECIKKG